MSWDKDSCLVEEKKRKQKEPVLGRENLNWAVAGCAPH